MDLLPNILATLSGIYAISSILDDLIEAPKDLKIIKANKEKHLIAYDLIDQFSPIKNQYNIETNDINQILNNISYPQELKDIIIKFKEYIDKENLIICLQRLNGVQINYINILHDIKKYLHNFVSSEGSYIPKDNTINIYKIFDKKSVLAHEFLHMASTEDNQNSGFCTCLEDIWIGNGLDEGYTELLNKRIFKNKKISYSYNVEIIELLELFFDNPKDMEYAYFHNNIYIVYQTFLKYGTKEEFFKLIQTLDNLIETDIPFYQRINKTKTKIKLYKILKRSNDKNKILNAKKLLDKDPLITIIHKKNLIVKKKSKTK